MDERQAQFERAALPHFESLLRYARRRAADDSAARNLLQETWLRAWRAFAKLRPDANVRAWLFRILHHSSVDAFDSARHSVPTRPLREGWSVPVRSGAECLEVRDALDMLPEEQRQVILMAVVEGYKCREISKTLNIPIGTVMSRLSRGRQALREILMPRGGPR